MNKDDEKVLVVPAEIIFKQGRWQGLKKDSLDGYLDLIKNNYQFKRRGDVETDPSWQQIIPYIVFNYQDAFFIYKYLPRAGEQRLVDTYQIGVGGHINEIDVSRSNNKRMKANGERIVGENVVLADESYDLMGLLFEVHNKLGPIYKEKNYQDAIEAILKREKILYEREKNIPLEFESIKISNFFADFIVDKKILIEVKSTKFITQNDIRQTLRYIRSTNLPLGIIVNFRSDKLEYKRLINPLFGKNSVSFDKDSSDVLEAGMMREWDEEVEYKGNILEKKFIGLLNDDSRPVEAVHLGLVYNFVGDSPEISIKEKDKMLGELVDIKDIEAKIKDNDGIWIKLVYRDYLKQLL